MKKRTALFMAAAMAVTSLGMGTTVYAEEGEKVLDGKR